MPTREAIAANRILLTAIFLAASYTLMRAVGDSLFLSRIGNDSLAAVFVASGIATAALASIWYVLTRKLSLSRLLKISGTTSAGLTLFAWAALPFFHHSWWLLAAIYLLTELKGCVNAINIVTATNEILGGHSSRHAWVRIGLGAPLAGVVIGLLIGVEANSIDVGTWLLISAGFDLLALLPLNNASRLVISKSPQSGQLTNQLSHALPGTLDKVKQYAWTRQFRLWFGTLIAAKVVVLTLVTFYWKVSVNDYFGGNEQSLTRYFGIFYACVGILTLVLQGIVTGRLLKRRALKVPILVMPITLAVLSVAMMIGTGLLFLLVVMTLAKSVEVWRRSVHDTTLSLLYTRIERRRRRPTISFNTGVIKPLAEVSASLFLLLTSTVSHLPIMLLVACVWMIAALALLRLISQSQSRPALVPPSVRRVRRHQYTEVA